MKNKKNFDTYSLVLCAMFTALSIIGAFLRIPVPYVPITMQLTFTTLAGLLLGAKRGTISVMAYIILGLAGLPIFTQGGGIGYVFQPTFGYIIGFMFGAFAAGIIVGNGNNVSYKRYLVGSFMSLLICYTFGTVYFYIIMNLYLDKNIGISTILLSCFLTVIPGDIIMSFLSAWLAKKLRPHIKL